MSINDLRKNDMMGHLMDALEQGKDIGHYGRLVFAMVGHHFMEDEELVQWLCKDKKFSDEEARALCQQVKTRGYNPPRRQKILDWQEQQEFPICPDGADPDSCNVYKNLKFPEGVYEHIENYYEQKAQAASE